MAALPESSMEWLHTKDFGNAFRWKMIEFIEIFSWQPQVPARKFLDAELERLRLNLVESAKDLIHVAASYTDDVHPGSDADTRKIPDQYDEKGNYSDSLFFQKARELNEAAEKAWESYQKLVRRARVKLAHSEASEEQ